MTGKKGLLVVISAPSGTGKGTLIKRLRDINGNIRLSVSVTTRKPRENEIDGRDYFFRSMEEFERMADNGELIEWVRYCDNFYGTPLKFVEQTLAQGNDILLEIEVEGAANIREKYPEAVLLFILPPSFEELKRRIMKRGTESPEVIGQRIERAKSEIGYIGNYDYVVVNDEIDRAADDINCILRSEKLRVSRNQGITKDIK